MKIGYCRVSTSEQTVLSQRIELEKAGCEMIFEDRMTGTRMDRPGLEAALSHLRPNADDCLVVWKLDRLGRGLKGLVTLIGELEEKGIQFQSLTESICTSTPSGRMIFHVIGAMAQMERELIAERTACGLRACRARGVTLGRKRKLSPNKMESARKLLSSGMAPKDVAMSLGVSIPTLYRWLPASARS